MNWYRITNKKMLIIMVISILWIIAGWILYDAVGQKHAPKGGLDSVGAAVAYVFFWKLIIYVPPVLVTVITGFMWLYQNHRKAVIWVILAVFVCAVLVVVYNKVIRRRVYTPEYVAGRLRTYEEWQQYQKMFPVIENTTESDRICDYIEDTVYDALVEFGSFYSGDEIALKTDYINAALEAHYSELPGVEGWEYIPDVRTMIPARNDGDDSFLLVNSDFCAIADHYGRTLRQDHRYDRYYFRESVIAEFYSWLPMLAVFYDDGTMDLLVSS